MKKSISLAIILGLALFCISTDASENINDNKLIEGHVILEFVVTEEGTVRDPKVIKSVPSGVFDEAALEKARGLRFNPPMEKGKPVEAVISKAFGFKMPASEFEANKVAAKGIKHLRNGEYEDALSYFNDAIRIAPQSGQYYDLRGKVYYELKYYKKAAEDFSKAIENRPEMIDAYFDRGEAYRKLGKYGESIDDYTKVVELDDSYLQAYNSRAVSYNRLKEMGNMCSDLKKACGLGDCRGIKAARNAGKCN